jgi:hypothetical protein
VSISKGTAKLLLKEGSERKFTGSILQLGRQTFHFSENKFSQWAEQMETQLSTLGERQDKEGVIDDIRFFKLLGFREVFSADYSDNEKPNFIFDLNYPVPEEYKNRFDVIYDGGTMEHCFSTLQVLKNIHFMLKVGGRVIHASPSNNHVDHGFYMFSPTLFTDYYDTNLWKVHTVNIFKYTVNHMEEPWLIFNYIPGCLDRFSFGGFRGKELLGIWCVCEKTNYTTNGVIPSQRVYTKMWNKEKETQSLGIKINCKGKRIKIFGASKLGEQALEVLRLNSKIIGFLDNDEKKKGTDIHNIPINLPGKSMMIDCDCIVIASVFASEIYQQLLKFGISKENIAFFGFDENKIYSKNLFKKPVAIY